MKFFALVPIFLVSVLFFSACAPQPESGKKEQESQEPGVPVESPSAPQPEPAPVTASRFDPENPDWELRYRELYEQHLQAFQTPTPGQPITLKLAAGREVKGVLSEVTDEEVVVDIGSGMVTYPARAVHPESASRLFASVYAKTRAQTQGRREVQRWQRAQQAGATPTPLPRRGDPGNIAARPGANGVDPEDLSTASGSVPKNEGPDGRVWQVDQYIRNNAALPHTLRINAWGPVQPHESGYKVRVQYSLESAAGLGVSNEDMMFFMNRNGRVYRRAPVK